MYMQENQCNVDSESNDTIDLIGCLLDVIDSIREVLHLDSSCSYEELINECKRLYSMSQDGI